MDLPLIPRLALKEALKKIEGTDLEKSSRNITPSYFPLPPKTRQRVNTP